ncbi:MAG: TetR/AcrR family transcriptional regulator [Treponema sp.]|nr:TetR/AcrR family transcriptional regulator [Treponema sp.]
MAVLVEHDKRKHEILEKALALFIEEGYEDVTFQKIADRCNITRTTLYIYFKNKREIFLWSIKQLTSGIECNLAAVISDHSLSAEVCLKNMLNIIVDECEKNQQLFKVLLVYFIQLQKSGEDPSKRVRRRVIRMLHMLNTVIIRGIRNGEFKQQSVKDINELLYSLIESAIFRLAILGKENLHETRDILNFAVDSICKKSSAPAENQLHRNSVH